MAKNPKTCLSATFNTSVWETNVQISWHRINVIEVSAYKKLQLFSNLNLVASFRKPEELWMKLCSATHSALLPVNKRERVFAPQQFQSRLSAPSQKINLDKSGYQGAAWSGLMSVSFSIVCRKVFQNRYLQNISAFSPTVNTTHIHTTGEKSYPGTAGILNIMAVNYYHKQGTSS